MPEITFRKATKEDVPIYIELEKLAPSDIYARITDEQAVEKEIENNEVYLILKDDKVIGTTEYTMKSPDHAYLGGLLIHPDFRGQGIGRKAAEFRLNQLKGIKRIDLHTHPRNSRIIRLYLSLGFVIEAWKDNYFGDGEPRLVIVREQ